jgi:PKD repeat protein
MKKFISLFLILSTTIVSVFAQTTPVSKYTFSQFEEIYTEISGGIVHGNEYNDDNSFNAINLGFTFNYNNVDYTQISIQTNGFIAVGSSVNNSTSPISSSSGTNNVIVPFGRNLIAQTSSELMSKTEGSYPNRLITIQWKNYRIKWSGDENSINFQIKLYESSNKIEFIYGDFLFTTLDAYYNQTGLRGNSNSDFNNRRTYFSNGLYYEWIMSSYGTSNYHKCIVSPNRKPQNGFTFVYEEPYSLDIGIVNLTNPDRIMSTASNQNIKVSLKNFGTTALNSATIKWKINNGTENSYSWTGSLAQGAIAENINIGTYDFSTENHFSIEVWTENPNSFADQNPNNDYFKSYHAINQYCSANLVYDEWWYIEDVIIGNIYHFSCWSYDTYSVADYSSHFNANYTPGSNLNYTINVNAGGYVAFWIDYNDDNDFEDENEYLGTSEYFAYNETATGVLTLSEDAAEGMHKLRVRYIWTSEGNFVPGEDDACTPLSSFMYEGDAHDYAINIYNPSGPPPCAFNPIPENNSVDVVLNEVLEWNSESATNFDVYFGTNSAPPFIRNQTENFYEPGLLDEFTIYYWKIIAKNEFGAASGCETWSFTSGDEIEYCIPGYSDCFDWDDMIDDFYMEDLIHENSGCSAAGYGDFTETGFTTDIIQGANVTWAANYGSQDALAIWIDFNDDGIFNETDEFVYRTEPVNGQHVYIDTDNFGLPVDAPLGTHRMRVRCVFTAEVGNQFEGDQSCSGIGYGETHDYIITIIEPTDPPDCANTPFPGDASTNQYLNTDLSWSASMASSYEVYFGTTSLEFMGEVIEIAYDPGILEPNTEYQWQIIPKNGAGSASGCDVWTFTTGEELEFCDYLYYGDQFGDICEWGDYIDDFLIGDLNHTGTGCTSTNGYVDYTGMIVNLAQGSNYTWNAVLGINNSDHLAIWFDTNSDGCFDESECLYTSDDYMPTACSGTISIPGVAELGEHRMRVRVKFGGDPFAPGEACYAFTYGEAHDYTVNVTEPTQAPDCAIDPEPVDGTSNVILNFGDISWRADYASEFDVYFGADENPPLVSENQNYAYYNPGILEANTTYYWKIIPSNILGGPDDCDVWSFTTAEDLEYCVDLYLEGLDYNCQWGDEIDDFSIAAFEHLGTGCYSDNGQAVDYTDMTFELEKGNTYTWTVTNNNAGWNHFAIWIDYNDDGEFNNSNEFLYTTENLIPASFSDTLYIDESAPIGEHRIRLRLKSSHPPMIGDDACSFFYFGETHDYTVIITGLSADFTADVTEIQVGESVQFTDLSLGEPISWEWVFEGGTPETSNDQNPLVQYNTIGSYDVTLTVTSIDNTSTITKEDYITVGQVQATQTIDLSSGYQFISSRIISENPDMLIVMADVLNDNLDFVRNSLGQTLHKIGPNWVNGIGDWIVSEGYLVKMFADDSFNIGGDAINPATPIQVTTGYQFVSYFPETPMDAMIAFETIIGDDLDFIRNSLGQTLRKIGPNWVNGLGNCSSSEGYLIKMLADGEIIYPVAAKSSGKRTSVPTHFIFEGGNPADPVFTIYIEGLDIGDEVAAFDGDEMVGALKINSRNTFDNDLPVFNTIVSGQGYAPGKPMTLKVWDNKTNRQIGVNFEFSNPYGDAYNSNIFPGEDGEYSILNITKNTMRSDDLSSRISIYPNPAKDEINIVSDGIINKIEIMNSSGQILITNVENLQKICFNVESYSSGVYFIKIYTQKSIINKMIVIQ